MAEKPKPRAIPTIAMVKRDQPKVGTREWIEEVARRHGSTEPDRLEHRRNKISVYVALMEETLKQAQLTKKSFMNDCEKKEKEFLASIELAKKSGDKDGLEKWEHMQMQLVREYRGQLFAIEMGIAQLQGQICSIEAWTQMIDHLGLRVTVKAKKSGKKGTYRYSAASYLAEIGWYMREMYEILISMGKPGEEGGEDEGEEDMEAPDDDVLTDDEKEKDRAQYRKKLEGRE